MEKINCCTNNTMQKINTCTKEKKRTSAYYRINLQSRSDRYDARISLPILKVGANPRITASSSRSIEEALLKLLDNIKNSILQEIDQDIIQGEHIFNIFEGISASFNELEIKDQKVLTHFQNIVCAVYEHISMRKFSSENSIIKNDITSNNDILETKKELSQILSFEDVAIKWFNYKNTFTKKTKDNPNPLSRKTLQSNNNVIMQILIPFFKKYNNIDDITDKEFQRCIDETNGDRYKEIVYMVLKAILNYAKENNYISYSRTIEKPPKAKKTPKLIIEGHEFVYVKSSRQNYWLDCFEKENTDISLLFEGMLLEGFRPEEACGLTWESLVEDFNYFIVGNAFKDFPVYNEKAEIIGHVREYDKLKTEGSYRKIPVHPRYRDILINHKEKQIKNFKKINLKWNEKTAIFLNRFNQPYISENLSKRLISFRKKYNLEYLTPYGLRHSFATFLSERGMKDIVLMKLMGHTDFNTTQKYYIFVSDERKKKEYEQAWQITATNKLENQSNIKKELLEHFQELCLQSIFA